MSITAADVTDSDLRRIYLFAGLDDSQLQSVKRNMRVQEFAEGERLFDYGQPARHYFFVQHGQVKLFRVSPDGDEKVIEIIQPGQTFAEAVMFMERQAGYPVSAEAIEPTEVWIFDHQTLLGLLRQSVDACFRLMANMSMRLRKHVNEVDKLTLHNATFRLVSYLLQQMPPDVVESPEVQLTTPKNVIASRLSIQPETFSRILGRLSKAGLIQVRGNSIVLRDIAGLRKLIEL